MNTALAPLLAESFSLYDRVIVIAANDGFRDSSLSESLLSAGAQVVFAGRNLPALERIAHELSPHRARAIFLDSTRKQSCKEALASVIQRYGRVDVLINALSNLPSEPTSGSSDSGAALDDWQLALSQGLGRAYFPSEIFGTYMSSLGRGTIINLADDSQANSDSQLVDVALTTRYLSEYFSLDGVRVNALFQGASPLVPRLPAFVARTVDLFPLSRMQNPNRLSSALLYLATDASANLSGTTVMLS